MRATIAFVVAALMVTTLPTALATHKMSGGGSFLVGNPGTTLIGVSELASARDPDGTANGIDGDWYEIDGFGGHDLTLDMEETLDVDAWFYDAECGFLASGGDETTCATFENPEECTVPDDAAYMIVNAWFGTGDYSFTIS